MHFIHFTTKALIWYFLCIFFLELEEVLFHQIQLILKGKRSLTAIAEPTNAEIVCWGCKASDKFQTSFR